METKSIQQNTAPKVNVNTMKFPRPRQLLINEYPDLVFSQPELLQKMVTEIVHPKKGSKMDRYYKATIEFLKDQKRQREETSKLNNVLLGKSLFFIEAKVKDTPFKFRGLVDTGATNSLIHHSLIEQLGLPMEPLRLNICTATGSSNKIVKGSVKINFLLETRDGKEVEFTTTFIVTTKLNNLDAIFGAEFLFHEENMCSINAHSLVINFDNHYHSVPLWKQNPEINRLEYIELHHSISHELHNDCQNHDSCYLSHHAIKKQYQNEVMPPSEEFFDNFDELKFEELDKVISLDAGDYDNCPKEWQTKVRKLVEEFSDRFSKNKLDIEITDLYEASLPTEDRKIVCQKSRRLPHHRYEFGLKAVEQLEQAGVVRKSDSEWRSNVVMVPKPVNPGDNRGTTKAEKLTGHQNTSQLYRLCLDFRELNDVLIFPQQCQFTTIDKFLHTLKNKWVVKLDISSSFFVIPIKEKDRHKTAFWLNDLSYEFCVLVMGLKSSPYHLNKFLEKVFSKERFEKLKAKFSEQERKLLPEDFTKLILYYFDDQYVFAETLEKLYVNLKIVLLAAREAKIKYSIEKSSFFTKEVTVLGYVFNTEDVVLTMDKAKASGILNMKKPSSLYELHSRLASFQYQNMFLPFIKHILYPLNFLLRKKEFTWGDTEETAWQLAKQLSTLNLRLTIPDPTDELVLVTDASKIAASAILYRVRNGKLQLVSVSSKYFATADLNKCSYMLESIALAFGMKTFSAYLLNCNNTVKIFTDAKSLVYAKRNASHSILLNSTLNYITNMCSLIRAELYHIPGTINLLADVVSRAVADNLNCALPREHVLSKTWAARLPPLPDNLAIDSETLFKFLTEPLKPESQDIYDKTMRKLMEPKSVQVWYDETTSQTPEEKYFHALKLLEQWNYETERLEKLPTHWTKIHINKLEFDVEKEKLCLEEIDRIMDKVYPNVKNSLIFKRIRKSLIEASQRYLKICHSGINEEEVFNLTADLDIIKSNLSNLEKEGVEMNVNEMMKNNFVTIMNIQSDNTNQSDFTPTLIYTMSKQAKYLPSLCENSNGIDLPMQEALIINPGEVIKTNLRISFKIPKHHCGLLLGKSSAKTKYGISITLGLIDIGFRNEVCAVLQNICTEAQHIPAGIALCQLLLIPSYVPKIELASKIDPSNRGSFGSTGHSFKEINWKELELESQPPVPINIMKIDENQLAKFKSYTDPDFFSIDSLDIKLLGSPEQRCSQLNNILSLETDLLDLASQTLIQNLPIVDLLNVTTSSKQNTSPTTRVLRSSKNKIEFNNREPKMTKQESTKPILRNLRSSKGESDPKNHPGIDPKSISSEKPIIDSREIKPSSTSLDTSEMPQEGTDLPEELTNESSNNSKNKTEVTNKPEIDSDINPESTHHENSNLPDTSEKDNILDIKYQELQENEKEILTELLNSDLINERKISPENFISLQKKDERLNAIMQNLIGNENAYNFFFLKSGIVCRKFNKKHPGILDYGICIPDILLDAVMIYIHKKFLHPSITQTYKEFCSLYYHAFAKKSASKICKLCITCTQSRNVEFKEIPQGKERSIKPTKPRQAISMDILYLPKSSKNHSHGLIITDLYSMYLYFYPLKSKSSSDVATAFRSFISTNCAPEIVYTDCDQSFRGELENVLAIWNIKHITSFPYSQRQNSVESQVRTFKNALRAALLESTIFKTTDWHILYPLAICRINTMLTKYGVSRELVHFENTLMTNLPLILDESFDPLEKDLDTLSKRFKEKIGRFMNKKKRDKSRYKLGKSVGFYLHELVMRRVYVPENVLEKRYEGPYRIIGLHPRGATIKDPKNGDTFSATFENLRKVNLSEVLTFLPENFDSELKEVLGLHRYNKSETQETTEEDQFTFEKPEEPLEKQPRILRSGKIFNFIHSPANTNLRTKILWTKGKSRKFSQYLKENFNRDKPRFSILKRKPYTDQSRFFSTDQYFLHNIWHFEARLPLNKCHLKSYQPTIKSSFSSPGPGKLILFFEEECSQNISYKKVKFDRVEVNFYDDDA